MTSLRNKNWTHRLKLIYIPTTSTAILLAIYGIYKSNAKNEPKITFLAEQFLPAGIEIRILDMAKIQGGTRRRRRILGRVGLKCPLAH
jgi:hypothetical protein